jgi:hypothetical protein
MAHITDLKLYKENGAYYLSASICHEDNRGVYEISIPRVKLPVSQDIELCNTTEHSYWSNKTTVSLNFGLGKLYAEPFNDDGSYFVINQVEEKVHEMTLAEIEKELGYKIKLKENMQ